MTIAVCHSSHVQMESVFQRSGAVMTSSTVKTVLMNSAVVSDYHIYCPPDAVSVMICIIADL